MRSIRKDKEMWVLVGGILGLAVVFGSLESRFLTLENLRIVLETMSILTILSIGLNNLLIVGEMDISFTSTLELAAALFATLTFNFHVSVLLALILALLGAVLVGVINGFFSVKVGIPSFLVTLATQVIVGGIVFLMCNYSSILISNRTFLNIFYSRPIGHVATSVYWAIFFSFVMWYVLRKTRFGRWTYATGGDEEASRLMGIPTKKVKFTWFVINSLFAAIAGFILASRSMSARPLMSSGYLMPAIAAPIMGGASLTGGHGSVIKTLLAVFLLTLVNNGVSLLGMEPAYRDIFMGVVLVVALTFRHAKSFTQRD